MIQDQATAILPITTKGYGYEESRNAVQMRGKDRRARLYTFSLPPPYARIGPSCLALDKKKPLSPSEILGSPEGVRLFSELGTQRRNYLAETGVTSGEASETYHRRSWA